MKSKTAKIVSGVLMTPPLLMVTMSGVMKLTGATEVVENMAKAGFASYLVPFGVVELLSVLFVFFKPTYRLGFLLLCCYLGGAFAIELGAGKFPVAAVLLIFLWAGTYLRNPALFKAPALAAQ